MIALAACPEVEWIDMASAGYSSRSTLVIMVGTVRVGGWGQGKLRWGWAVQGRDVQRCKAREAGEEA